MSTNSTNDPIFKIISDDMMTDGINETHGRLLGFCGEQCGLPGSLVCVLLRAVMSDSVRDEHGNYG